MARPFILIPAHNRREFTVGCLERLRANGDLADCSVIVVDDGSTDGTGEAIARAFPDVVVVPGDGSLFWTRAMRLAMREAEARGAGPLFWLNDDCHPQPGALRNLREFLEKNPDALVGPRCVDKATGRAVPTGFTGRRTFSPAPGEELSVQGLSGFCVGLGANASRRLGPPDAENFPHYYGDTAYTIRASRAGTRVVLLGAAAVDLVDHRDGPAQLRERVRTNESLAKNWRRIFWGTNSPYRLRTLFAFQRLKYGAAAGTALAAARAASWIGRFMWAKAVG
jgi:GT2 family glycosyltransferase